MPPRPEPRRDEGRCAGPLDGRVPGVTIVRSAARLAAAAPNPARETLAELAPAILDQVRVRPR